MANSSKMIAIITVYIYTYIYIVYVGMCKDGNTYTYNPCMFSRQKNTAIQ